MLLSHSPQDPLSEVSVVTNGLILDLVKTYEATVRCVERLTAKLINIKKQHSSVEKDELMSLLLQEFCIPKLGFHKENVVNFCPEAENVCNKSKCN